MLKSYIIFTYFLLVSSIITAQKNSSVFSLNGFVNIDTGQVYLKAAGNNSYYPNKSIFYKKSIKNGSFTISDSCRYPYAVYLSITIGNEIIYISDYFFIEPGIQTIRCNIDSSRSIPFIENKTMRELKGIFFNATAQLENEFIKIQDQYDSLYKIYTKNIPTSLLLNLAVKREALKENRQEILYQYATKNPNSYVALWALIRQLGNGYEPILDSIYKKLSASLKKTYSGKQLANTLTFLRVLAIGNPFPQIPVADTNLIVEKLRLETGKAKYIFIDFWYSHCGPCISEFMALKKIYTEYSLRGFSIIGISVDSKKDIPYWKTAIKQYGLIWPQYLDLGGDQSSKLSIHLFPTNFLLDTSGKIIKRDIEMAQLIEFLKNNIL